MEVLSMFREKMRAEERADGVRGGDRSDALPLAQGEDQPVSHDAVAHQRQQHRVLRQEGLPMLSLEQLHVPVETQAVLQEAMVLTGACDLLSYLLAAGEREARRLCDQARRKGCERYARMPTSQLVGMKTPEAGNERYRRAVYMLMQWNESHRPLEQWYITTVSIQKLVGGRKDAIKAYVQAYHEEIEEHHERLSINLSYNCKAEPLERMIMIPEDPMAFPWGQPVEG